ncbi:MAG: uracil-DNA glycosylase family protein [bacterium]
MRRAGIVQQNLETLLRQVRDCKLCEKNLPLGPRPVVSLSPSAHILVIGQAPGSKVHTSGIPWDDASGKRLREWMGVELETFYDNRRIAIIPMGLCYPGKGKSGDLPPRKECAPLWHQPLIDHLPELQLTLLIGQYAQKYYLPNPSKTLAATVQRWEEFAPKYLPLPHPSPRNQLWLEKNPWFEAEVVPELQRQVQRLL